LDFLILAKSFLIVNQSPLFLKNQSWYSCYTIWHTWPQSKHRCCRWPTYHFE